MNLDGVGPVDNRPSTDKLNHKMFTPKKFLLHQTNFFTKQKLFPTKNNFQQKTVITKKYPISS